MNAPSSSRTDQLVELIADADSVVALTGAGISVPSGIPDFRSPGTGLWEGIDPMEVAHIDVFHRDPQRFWHFYGERFATLDDKKPNAAHGALVELEQRGILSAVITQNVDCLHRKAGTRNLIEVHGSIAEAVCLGCGSEFDLSETTRRIAISDDGVPLCDCAKPLKPGVVLFGEMLAPQPMLEASTLALGAGVLLCVGSSLEVYPVANLPALTLGAGGKVALVTKGQTPYDKDAAVKLDGDVVSELEALVAAL